MPARTPRKRGMTPSRETGLREYRRIRGFRRTPEPRGRVARPRGKLKFVVQEHHASVLHYDFRLEIGGVLKSWSVPKGPSLDPRVKRLAVQVDDHPLDYLTFKGRIPEGNYGAGRVYRWDLGTFEPLDPDPFAAWQKGALRFHLNGDRLGGDWRLVRMGGGREERKPLWLLIKVEDAFARAGHVANLLGEKRPAESSRRTIPEAPSPRARRASPAAVPLEEFLERRDPKGGAVVSVEGTSVELTSLDRVYWPREGITKFELLRYYASAWPRMKPFLVGRPAILQRHPKGIAAPMFFQHDLDGAPRYVATRTLTNAEGRPIDYAVYTSLASLLYLTNLGTVEHHPWHSTVRDLERPDWLVLDLDPGPRTRWQDVLDLALVARDVFKARGLRSYPKTSGSRGIHVYLPLKRHEHYPAVSERAKQLAAEIAGRSPRTATLQRAKARRGEKRIYVDWLQNARGKSMAAPYSVRARPGAPLSMPVSWEDVEGGVKISDFTLRRVPAGEPGAWDRFFEDRQELRNSA